MVVKNSDKSSWYGRATYSVIHSCPLRGRDGAGVCASPSHPFMLCVFHSFCHFYWPHDSQWLDDSKSFSTSRYGFTTVSCDNNYLLHEPNTASRLLSQGDARVWGTFFGVSRSAQASRLISFRVIIPINPLSADGFSAGPALPKRSSLSPQWCAASRKTTSAVVFLKENPEKACDGCQELFCGFVGTTMTFL